MVNIIRTTIPQFISRFEKPNTKLGYTLSLTQFFDGFAKMTPEAYFSDHRNPEQDLHDFKAHLKANGLAPKSICSKVGCVFSYFIANRVITHELWKELNLTNQSRVQDKVPTITELKSILQYTDIRGKALFLLLASSGMRLQDALSIKMDDAFFSNLNKNPPRIWTHCHKVNTDYWAFMTDEARDAIKAWLKVRVEWLRKATLHCQSHGMDKEENDTRLFPFSSDGAHKLWNKSLHDAGLTTIDKNTKQPRRTIHIHTLRKFQRNVTGLVLSHDVCEALLCHLTGMTKIYFRPDGDKDLAPEYVKVMDKLRVFTTPVPDITTATTVDQQNDKIASLERIVQQLLREQGHQFEPMGQ
ncbi:MAG: tyrosine-type recombinase/integrase [Euryarchaeota archaeon]|nr:tyrosine-type recombinase/integrase [Euryarchaeota archaeon]